MEVPCVRVLCGQASGFEILLGEGGDVELSSRTSKQILLFALDPLTLTLSLSLSLYCALHYFILIIHIYSLAWLCVHHLLVALRVIAISF